MIFQSVITRHVLIVAMGAVLAACASSPSADIDPTEIGQNLGFSTVTRVDDVPAPATFTLEDVNSRVAVMEHRFGRKYLIVFAHSCPEVAFGGTMKTTATGGRLDTEDSIVIDERYCRIGEIYLLQ